jgi:peptidoglycan hydrolase-like protein with peptidoglycan-binding domain
MPELAIDTSYSHPNPSAISQAGYTTVIRYLSPDPAKNLSPSEAAGYHAAGLKIALIWESTGQRALDGAPAGNADAVAALHEAEALGYLTGCVIFTNIGDFAAVPAQLFAIHSYYSTWAGAIYGAKYVPGGYGTGYIIDSLIPPGYQGIWWQNAMNDEGDLGSNVSPHASLYQRVSPTKTIAGAPAGSYDEDVILRPFPTWGKTVIPPPPSYPPFPGRLIQLESPYQEGSDIMEWQSKMKSRGWALTVDGIYGPQSESVCRQFQAQKQLTVDGKVGNQTWTATWAAPITLR